ncbi:L,D-transpeptidase [Salisaeta longa]|uniref:L,D-transpeptidase n=1 Tax=Salisaeta longa TaxID=503170 RepID=UPI0004905490|nr:L,D-transpeptidase [Salisaeta longa]
MRSFRLYLVAWMVVGAGVLWAPAPAHAQGFYDQYKLEELLSTRAPSLNALPDVFYEYYVLDHPSGNSVLARNQFYRTLGDGSVELGTERAHLVELLNRKLLGNTALGDTLVVPTRFGLDFRAYSPFPRYYPGARSLNKLFIIHKRVQAFAAYEYGRLVRWGIVNTGKAGSTETPNGRFNFNWKEEYRVSSLSPPDEEWEMYWVFNFHNARGIHVHQYAMPTGGPASHGCVRLVDIDAKWIYDWAEPWNTTAGGVGYGSINGRLLDPGTMVLVLGDEPKGLPRPFIYKKRYPILDRVSLPNDPYSVPPGSEQQRMWDRIAGRE